MSMFASFAATALRPRALCRIGSAVGSTAIPATTSTCAAAAAATRAVQARRTYMRGLEHSSSRKLQRAAAEHAAESPHLLRGDALLAQTTNLIMRDGKKERASRLLRAALDHVRAATVAAATNSGRGPRGSNAAGGLTGAGAGADADAAAAAAAAAAGAGARGPDAQFADAVARVSPLLVTKAFKRGNKVLQIPKALTERQRLRRGIVWILEAAGKRSDKQFGARLGNEILAVLDGSSEALKRKNQVYKTALANRVNVNIKMKL